MNNRSVTTTVQPKVITDGQRFSMVMFNIAGKSLPYDELTAKLRPKAQFDLPALGEARFAAARAEVLDFRFFLALMDTALGT